LINFNKSFTFWNKELEIKGTYVRLVDFNSTEEKRSKTIEAIQNPNCGWFYTAIQKDFEKIPGSPIGYWFTKSLYNVFKGRQIGDVAPVRKGNSTSNNARFLRYAFEINKKTHSQNYSSINESLAENKYWIPYNKGGGFRKWFGFQEYLVYWKDNAKDIRSIKTSVVTNEKFYMKPGLTWSTITSSDFSLRWFDDGFIFDNGGCCLFIDNELERKVILGAMNSVVFKYVLSGVNPTLNFQSGEVSKFPFIKPIDTTKIEKLVEYCIAISKEEWNSKEISWCFLENELLKHNSRSIIESYELYQQYWLQKYLQIHKNEEELNKQFIEIYSLQNELKTDVPLEEITILKEETSIENGELVFHADEVLAQFVSYAVGCMFGRYSLDKEGLILANQGETLKEYLSKVSKNKEELSFMPDEDNVIPLLDDEWFEDDIVARFHSFLKASFGEKEFQKNLAFVEECLGKDIRKYFVKDFYKDHIKRYKKRPVYWMFSSPKGYFNVLIYMHRYTQDTLSTILNGYLREFIGKLELQRKQNEHTVVNGSPAEQNRAQREIDKIDDMLADCRKYESEILYPLAGERISIDLDDGVLVNYNKFGAAIAPADGLNDKKTKKKVMEFDWIDTTQIR
jgi:hypothetical protein